MLHRNCGNRASRTFCLLLLIVAVFMLGSAQNRSHAADGGLPLIEEWRNIYAGPSDDYAYDLAVDSAGNVYLAGHVSGPRGTITKYDPAGTLLWNKSWRCSSSLQITVDSADAVYITGGVSGGAFLLKYHANGTLLLNLTWGVSEAAVGYDVAVSENGDIYIAGGDSNNSQTNARFTKFNSSGVLQWDKDWDDPEGYAVAFGIAVDDVGDIYLVGEFANFSNDNDVFLLKYNTAGDLLRTSYWHGVYDIAYSLVVDNESNCYVVGVMNDYTNLSALLLKFDSEGRVVWNRTLTGYSFQRAYGVALTGTTLYLACGDGDGALTAFTTEGTNLGNLTWAVEADYGRVGTVAIGSAGSLYLAGDFQNMTTKSTDRILIKYTTDLIPPALDLIFTPNPTNTLTTIIISNSTEPVTQVLVNITGPSFFTAETATYQGANQWTCQFTPSSDGQYMIAVNATDLSGNIGYTTGTIISDLTAPNISILSVAQNPETDVITIIVANTTEPLNANGIRILVTTPSNGSLYLLPNYDGLVGWNWSGSFTLTEAGLYKFSVNGTDLAGNTGAAVATFTASLPPDGGIPCFTLLFLLIALLGLVLGYRSFKSKTSPF